MKKRLDLWGSVNIVERLTLNWSPLYFQSHRCFQYLNGVIHRSEIFEGLKCPSQPPTLSILSVWLLQWLTLSSCYQSIHDPSGCPHSKDPKSPRCGTGDPGYKIEDEHTARISNTHRYIVHGECWSQFWWVSFFINTKDNAYLDWFNPTMPYAHPVFGKVIDGLDVVQAIQAVPTDSRDNPNTPVKMESITINR